MSIPFTKITTIPLGPIPIQAWGLMVALGMLVGLWVALKEADRRKIKREIILDLFIWIVLSSMIGGRLMYVALFWSDFSGDLVKIVKIWEGGMIFYGGIFAAILAVLIYLRKKKISFWKVADILSPGFAIGIFLGRIGCYLIGDHIGKIMGHPWFWGAVIPGDDRLRHEPSLYLSLNGLLMFAVLWSLRKRLTKPSQLTMVLFIWYGISRFILDFFRANDLPGNLSDPRFWGLTISQWVSLGLFGVGMVGLFRTFFPKKH
ncbi:MAG: prolipoprotein diacylglyceryl transferase [Candidatus Peregrinibacteria bacterium GW2011_GWE2_39_6]|nr:MAG: prolipoprotein diacylglyceryl transferase [Candidatus Peregrinibacteria bacterium GW2011_GWF2_39_17]KKR26344.1 MAG: prolipoprotein diacylglyceryl transferase [Candidatus Peregrinibacteria bacterium GW2011_GWE2_39_6]HCW32827.1 prolipoprotein diacylglyceryl transferase [Candidatus Peregrinibacteria bacterium]